MGAILFWTDMKHLFNWNIDNFKSNFLSRGQLGSKSNDKFFLSVLKMWQCYKYFFGNLIFALTARTLSGNHLNHKKHELPYLPAYRPHFFQGKNVPNLGCGLYAGTRVLSLLICKISRHAQSQQSYWKFDSLIECIVWDPYEVKLIHVFEEFCFSRLQWVYLVSKYVCYWMESKEVCMSSHEALSMPFTWNCVCLFAELHEKYTEPVTKRESHKWNWYKISQFRSLIHIAMSSAINKRCGFIFTLAC